MNFGRFVCKIHVVHRQHNAAYNEEKTATSALLLLIRPLDAILREFEDIPHDGDHHEQLDDGEADDNRLNRLQGHAVVTVSPELSVILECEYVHLADFHDQILDDVKAEEVDEDKGTDLEFAENHEHLEASLTIEVGVLDSKELLLDFVGAKDTKEPVEVEAEGYI